METPTPQQPSSPSARVRGFLSEHVWLAVLIVLVALNAIPVVQNLLEPKVVPAVTTTETSDTVAVPPPGSVASRLNGAYIPEDVAERRPVAAMIDNLLTARPASGLSRAAWVWELPVEGGVTRLLAVWQTSDDVTLGPVRSAREYFLPLAEEFKVIYGHSGGSPAALERLRALRSTTLVDADEFRYGDKYYRKAGARPPHNLYTSTHRLQSLVSSTIWSTGADFFLPTPVSDIAPANGTEARALSVEFSRPQYAVHWQWDEMLRRYRRTVGSAEDIDPATTEVVAATTVIVVREAALPAPRPGVPDAVTLDLIGSGEALFFRDGQRYDGRWEKPAAASRMRFSLSNGDSFPLARGPVWVEVTSRAVVSNPLP